MAANGIAIPMPILAPSDRPPLLLLLDELDEFAAVSLAAVDVCPDKGVFDELVVDELVVDGLVDGELVVSGRSDFSQINGIPSA